MFKSSNNQKSNTLGPQRSAAPLTPVGQWSRLSAYVTIIFFFFLKILERKVENSQTQ